MFNKALIIGILLVGATFSVSAFEEQRWEYKCIETNRDRTREMSALEYVNQKFYVLGLEGWEMVGYAMNDGTNARIVCFKRRYDPRRPLYED